MTRDMPEVSLTCRILVRILVIPGYQKIFVIPGSEIFGNSARCLLNFRFLISLLGGGGHSSTGQHE